jgi:hypothetical protein
MLVCGALAFEHRLGVFGLWLVAACHIGWLPAPPVHADLNADLGADAARRTARRLWGWTGSSTSA